MEDPRLGDPKKQFRVYIEVINRGSKPVVIPTKGIGPTTTWNGSIGVFMFRPFDRRTRDGLRIVSSMTDLAPVELRSGEVAALDGGRIPKNAAICAIEYEVSPEFAKRYGFWSGKITAQIRQKQASGQQERQE